MFRGVFCIGAILTCLLASGCATNQNADFKPYTSPLKYANDDCRTLKDKAEAVDTEIRQLFPSAGPRTGQNTAAIGVGLFVFWPAFFLIQDTDSANSLAYTRLRGDMDAISKVATHNSCDFLPNKESKLSNPS